MNHFSEDTFDQFLSEIVSSDEVDLRDLSFIDPFGMVGIIEGGRYLNDRGARKKLLLPRSAQVMKYLERMDFMTYAGRYFSLDPEAPELYDKFLRSSQSDVLLEITPIEKSEDIHFIVDRVKKRAFSILERHLRYSERAIGGFIVALSEICQNIIEHSGNTGLVGIQKYYFQKQKKNVVKIAVMDLGIGFKESLSARLPVKQDVDAIEKALVEGLSRHRDEGRGHGLASVRRFIMQWNGKISIRSGRGKFSIIPEWAWGRKREGNLPFFPGAQIHIMLPEIS